MTHRTPAIADLVPHAGGMVLLERIVGWDETSIHTATSTHRSAQNPLRSNGRLRALHLCEYGAQAMAVHGGLLSRSTEGPAAGYLVTLREVELALEFIDDLAGELDVTATRIQGNEDGWLYVFAVAHRGERIATGRALVAFRRQKALKGGR